MNLTPADLTVGQKVWLRSNSRRGYGDKGASGERGTITKVGRKLVTIQSDTISWWSAQYRIEGQYINGQHTGYWFRTDAQVEAEERRAADVGVLRSHGLEVTRKADDDTVHAVAELLRGRDDDDVLALIDAVQDAHARGDS